MKINDVEFVVPLEDIFDELKTQLEINHIELLDHKRVSGDNIQCSCPFHKGGQERKPSFGISTKTGVGHCFTCGEVKDFPEIVSYCFGKKDNGAFGWEWLRRNFLVVEEEKRNVSLSIRRGSQDLKESNRGFNRSLPDADKSPEFVSEDELDTYRYYHPYWGKRGITDENIIELFDLGYDKQTDCITMPVRDIDGNCLFVARRSVKTKFFNYPKGVTKPLYGLYEISCMLSNGRGSAKINIKPVMMMLQGYIFVCESMIDCLLLWQSGKYAVALNGLGNQLQMKQLNDLPCRTLILCTDNDEAGYKARQRIRKYVKSKIIKEAILPANRKDIGEMTEEEIKNLEVVFV